MDDGPRVEAATASQQPDRHPELPGVVGHLQVRGVPIVEHDQTRGYPVLGKGLAQSDHHLLGAVHPAARDQMQYTHSSSLG